MASAKVWYIPDTEDTGKSAAFDNEDRALKFLAEHAPEDLQADDADGWAKEQLKSMKSVNVAKAKADVLVDVFTASVMDLNAKTRAAIVTRLADEFIVGAGAVVKR